MFGIRRLFYMSDKIVSRSFRSRRRDPVPANPGLQKRVQAFREEGIKVDDEDAEEFVEQSDSDFLKSGEVYNEHLNHTLAGKIRMRHRIIKEKYFKENMPNLLTWSEKDQIRHLATTQPDEWTPERIAESFPVTVAVVKKLLKYPWKPATEERIARHDASAMRNWRELKEGGLDIPEDLRQHFLKFSERNIPPLNKSCLKIDITPQKNYGEFEEIIRRCASNEETTKEAEFKQNEEKTLAIQNKPKLARKDSNRITLDELTERVKNRLESGGEIDLSDRLMLSTVSETDSQQSPNLNYDIELHKEENKHEVTEYKSHDEQNTKIMDYPERIRIPKKAYKKDATFKVNDCYYDHDGKFLYRVLGMTRN